MANTIQSISALSSIDIRQVLAATDTKFAGWCDRINKDTAHSSVYSYLNVATTRFDTVANTSVYNLTPTNIRRIKGMYDVTRNRILFPIERATSPVSQVEMQEPNPGQQSGADAKFNQGYTKALSLQTTQPDFFRHIGAQTVALIPQPKQALLINVTYEMQVVTIVNPTDQFIVPEDGLDMLVAGVNWLANAFLKRNDEAQAWLQIYQQLKLGQTLI